MAGKRTVPVKRKLRIGEVAGGTAAECAAVCCCCPCAVVHFVVMAVYTVPKGLLKKAVTKMKKRHRLLNHSASTKSEKNKNDVVLLEREKQWEEACKGMLVGPTALEEKERMEDVERENEMWARFSGTGFWRSESQRHP
ncbi:unnamed protein product [Lupinus luteus]|uniref:Transmembrane protein n=1 Tax=Lupinus luteus TaxID=3873 RepID=A0AAV1Y4L4_LUPLU